MWYDDKCLYISQKKIKDILKQNNMVTDLFNNKVKADLKKKELIKTDSKKDDTIEYSIKMPKRFNEGKSQKRAVCFYRGICRAQGYFCKTLAKPESTTENA